MATELWAVLLVVFGTGIGAFGPIFLKRASNSFGFNINGIIKNKNLIFGLFFYGIGTITFIPALKGGELSVLYPLVALGYVYVAFLSKIMLKEKITFLKWLGVSLIILGVSLIGMGS